MFFHRILFINLLSAFAETLLGTDRGTTPAVQINALKYFTPSQRIDFLSSTVPFAWGQNERHRFVQKGLVGLILGWRKCRISANRAR